MKVLLIKPPEPQNSETISGRIIEHLGLGYIAALLRKNDIEAEIIDARIEKLDYAQLKYDILSNSFDVLGISMPYQWSIPEALELIKALRKEGMDKPIVIGGHPPTFYYEELLKDEYGINYVCIGEGEYTIPELVRAIGDGNDVSGIKGLAYRRNGNIVFTGYRDLIANLDELPFPERDTVEQMLIDSPYLSIPISASRGCSWASCSFCDVQSFYKLCHGKNWRGRSPKNIVDEIEMLLKKFNHNKFSFVDDDFFGPRTLSRERVTAICDEIISRNLKIQFSLLCNVRDIDDEILAKLKSAGLFGVFLGIESGVQRALDTFNKGVSVKENKEAIVTSMGYDLECCCGSIFIDPYVTIDEIKENISFWESVGQMSLEKYKELIVFHGTPLQRKLSEENRIVWNNFDYKYQHTLDKDVIKLNAIIEKARVEHMTTIFNKPKRMETTLMRLVGENVIGPNEVEGLLNKCRILHEKLYGVIFTRSLKKIIDDLDNINEMNMDSRIAMAFEKDFSDFELMIEDLEENFKQVMKRLGITPKRRGMFRGNGLSVQEQMQE